MDISIDIKNCNSIEQALLKYTAPEYLVKDNQYKCEKCNKLRDAEKRITIHESPEILTLQLKRFGYRPGSKVTRHIKFPEKLVLDPYLSESKVTGKKLEYELYGVLMHSGHSTNSGHYFSFVKHTNGCWYKMNDEEVHPVNVQTVLSQCAYMLFYHKIGGKKTSSHKNGEKSPSDPKVVKNGHKKVKVEHKFSESIDAESEKLVKKPQFQVKKPHFQVEKPDAIPKNEKIKPGNTPRSINSTSHWAVKTKSKEHQSSTNSLNSTMSFTVKSLKKKNSEFLKSIGIDFSKEMETESTQKHEPKSLAISQSNGIKDKQTDIVDITNVPKVTPFDSGKPSGIVSWNHLATTDVVFNRNRTINEMESKKKRKRASRDDMEYDAPQLKGLKKVNIN